MTDRSGAALGLIALLDVFALGSDDAVRNRVIDTAAENMEAEIVGIVCDGRVVAATGIGGSPELEQQLIAASTVPQGTAPFGSLGVLHVASCPIEGSTTTRFVVCRSAAPFDPVEQQICRAMARVMRLAVRTISAIGEERDTSQQLEIEVARNRHLAEQLHRRHTDLMSRMLDLQGRLSSTTSSVLEAILQQGEALLGPGLVTIHLERDDGSLELRYHSGDGPRPTPPSDSPARAEELDLVERVVAEDRLMASGEIESEPTITGRTQPSAVAISAPIHQRHRAVGAMTVTSGDADRRFSRDDRETLLLLAGYASVAVSDALSLEQRQTALEQAEWQATHDPLTGLANRRLVLDTIDRRLADGEGLVVLYIDVDRFKSINDLYGHQMGDDLISEIGRRLRFLTRPSDLAGRLSGDEFIVVCGPESGRVGAENLAARLSDQLGADMELDGRLLHVTVSIGLATSEDIVSASDLINAADVAMYRAKSSGRDGIGLFDEELQRRIRRKAALAERLETILPAGDGFHIAYQPIVAIDSGVVCGHEALLRFTDPVLGQVTPDEFIPLAEELGLIAAIDEWVVHTVLDEASMGGDGTRLSVNVSPSWLADPAAVDRMVAKAAEVGYGLDRLSLEVTERVVLVDTATAVLGRLRGLGIKVLLDDFGTGYSSLAYMRNLDIDGIKIDRGFLDGIEYDRLTAAILHGIVTLTDRLGTLAIAEGVETAVQANVLSALGCRLAQGFYYGRPRPAPEGLAVTADIVVP
ncbi:MAG: putative bifunctional diguanylate cyclase/phosphodiesterase [Acidimicrobiales bacterium]